VAPTPVSATLATAVPSAPAQAAPEEPGIAAAPLRLEPSLPVEEAPPAPTDLPVEAEPALQPEPLATSALPTGPAEPIVESLNQSFPDEWEEAPAAAPAPPAAPAPQSEPPALSSSTLAELYFNQGFTRQAIDVYRELLEREPANERIRARIVELEAIERAIDGGGATPPPGDVKARRREAIERTITRLEGFLATVRRA
jgi:hypothetical protein